MIRNAKRLRQWTSSSIAARTAQAFVVGLVFLVLLVVPNTCTNAAEPSLDDALGASAADLAQAYVSTGYILENVLPYAEKGIVGTVHVGGEKITPQNAAKARKRYENRHKIYAKAVQQRGAKSLAGSYRVEATEPCSRSGSSWLAMVQFGNVSEIRIDQDGAKATLAIEITHEGKSHSQEFEAAVVESSIAVVDKMNSDYYCIGQKTDRAFTIRPDVRVLAGWPAWAAPPKREDILNCVVELFPLEAAQSPAGGNE